jgi:membrane protease YdiL (CAAX protease family)
MTRLIRSRPLVAYYVLACAISVALGLLLNVSLLFGLLALFGPAAAALIVARASEGRAEVLSLRAAATRWRVHPAWYAAAVALPVAGFALGHVAYVLAGHEPLAVPGTIQPIALVLFVLVIGEEIGWRGYLLRTLLRRHSPAVATAIVAIAWAVWHSPLYFVPGMPSYGGPFLAFVAWVIPLSVLLTWLWLGTRSAWLTTVMHGAANLGASLVFPMTDAATLFLFSGLGMTVVAAVAVITSWSRFTAPPERPAWRLGVAEARAALSGDSAT